MGKNIPHIQAHALAPGYSKLSSKFISVVSRPGEGECADPVNEDAILEKEGGGEPHSRNRERQLASDTGGDKTLTLVKWEDDKRTRKTTPSRLKNTSMHRVS